MGKSGLFDLTGRNALVTGAGRGLGAAMARALASHGANVLVFDSAPEAESTTVQSVRDAGAEAYYLVGDVTDEEAARAAVRSIVERWGSLDILVNNAGIALNGPAETIPMNEVHRVFDIDLFGMLQVSQAAFEALRASGRGAVLNIASIAGMDVLRPQKHIGYNTAKAGVIMLTKTLAVEWAETGIRVNAIAPGYMMSPAVALLEREQPDSFATWIGAVPMRRPGQPEELGGAAVYLVSDAASYVTGSILTVDGGYTCT